MEGAGYLGTLKSRIIGYYHWCEDDFIVSTQAILFGQLIWPPNNEVVQIESNVGLYHDKKGHGEKKTPITHISKCTQSRF